MSRRRKIILFDWFSGGHHAVYLRRITDALRSEFDVVLVVPDEVAVELGDLPVEFGSLGEPRPAPPAGTPASWALETSARELRLLRSMASRVAPDHVFHVYADTVLPFLTVTRRLSAPVTILLFYPRAHYPSVYQTPLRPSERVRAVIKNIIVQSWRQRPDANAVLTLDEEAARLWRGMRGAPASWLPEPPVPLLPRAEVLAQDRRVGCIVYGALAERKGIDLLSRAVSLVPNDFEVTLAGAVDAGFLPRLQTYAAEMRSSGATVHLRCHRHTELDGLRSLAASRCAVLPYPRHDGMSRVLLESASVGTPVIAHDRGLLGHLVRRYNLGVTVDCEDPRAFREALCELTQDSSQAGRYTHALTQFAARFSREQFEEACLKPFVDGTRGADDFRSRVSNATIS